MCIFVPNIIMRYPLGILVAMITFLAAGICYIIPSATAIIVSAIRKYKWKREPESTWLTLLLLGAAIFGVIDHLWNGELFLIGPHLWKDIASGTVITAASFVAWVIMVAVHRAKKKAVVNS